MMINLWPLAAGRAIGCLVLNKRSPRPKRPTMANL
ncbi:hypothetical protein JOD20_002865 [Herpetosiphon giganteus]|nr:hypothetical protein [Herpetosiphon giganteus]